MSKAQRRLVSEVVIVVTLTFGAAGARSILGLIRDLLAEGSLRDQSVTLHGSAAGNPLLDIGLQLVSSAVLLAYGALAVYLLDQGVPRWKRGDSLWGAGLALLIGLPGLALYAVSLHFGWTKEVVPADFAGAWWQVPVLLISAAATAWAEEVVVVGYLTIRFRQLRVPLAGILAAGSLLRASYHLYQGVSAGFGNLAMGIILGYFYHRTGQMWPLVCAHFFIDAVAFLGYALVF